MKYPQTLTTKLEEVKSIVNTWNVQIPHNEVFKWMMQFDNNDFDLAFRIIKNLNVIGYEELKSGLNIAYSKLERKSIDKNTRINNKNTLFAGIGEGAKSGAMITYNFRITNELSEENFLDNQSLTHIEKGRIENLVLVDDIISTGNQAINEINKLTDTLIPLGVKNIFLLTAVGMKQGIKKVEEETGAYVFSAFEYDISDTILSFDSEFYDGLEYEHRIYLKERLEYYGKICNPKSPLGYGQIGGLIVFYYNTPNSTIPHVWSFMNSWLPLFKRTIRINGIDSYYKQFDNLKSQKPKSRKEELTLFVESKSEEIFFEYLIEELKVELNVDKLNVISLGGATHSEKLIDNLNKTETKYLFIIEDDPYAPKGYKTKLEKTFKDKPHVMMKPILEYLNISSILNDQELPKSLKPDLKDNEINSREFKRDLEIRLFRRTLPSLRASILKKILNNHLDKNEIDELFVTMKQALHIKKSD